jgi:hypothetical protein
MAKVEKKHIGRVVAPPPAELDLSLTTGAVWMPFREAVARAGTFEALLPALSDGRIRARAADFYNGPSGGAVNRADHSIYPSWWAEARIDAASDRGYFAMEFFDMLAVGIELERAAVESLWPTTIVPASRHTGGRDPDHDWEGAASYVDHVVTAHGPLPRHKDGEPVLARAVGLMTDWFEKNDPPAPQERSIRRWIGKNPRSWWGPN